MSFYQIKSILFIFENSRPKNSNEVQQKSFAMSKSTIKVSFETCWALCKKPHIFSWSRSKFTFFGSTLYQWWWWRWCRGWLMVVEVVVLTYRAVKVMVVSLSAFELSPMPNIPQLSIALSKESLAKLPNEELHRHLLHHHRHRSHPRRRHCNYRHHRRWCSGVPYPCHPHKKPPPPPPPPPPSPLKNLTRLARTPCQIRVCQR